MKICGAVEFGPRIRHKIKTAAYEGGGSVHGPWVTSDEIIYAV